MAGIIARAFDRVFKVKSNNDLAVVIGTDDQALPNVNTTSEKPEKSRVGGMNAFTPTYDDSRNRLIAIKDFEMIDDNVPEFSRALTIIAGNATAGDPGENEDSFRLEFGSGFGQQDQDIVNDLVFHRLALDKRMNQIIRNANKYGDFFGEIIFDKQGIIWKIKYLDPNLTESKYDPYDRFLGYVYKGYKDDEQALAWWQVVHLLHDPEYGARYGRSLFSGGGRALAYRILAVRDSLAYETLNHATARNALLFARPERWSQERVQTWVDDLSDRLARENVIDDSGLLSRRAIALLNGTDVILDYPVDQEGKGNPPIIAPLHNAPVLDISSIAEHFQDLLFAVTGVPKSFLGVERSGDGLSASRLETQDLQFCRQLRRDQLDAAWFINEIIRRQFVLLGRPLKAGDVTVVMPDLRQIDEKVRADTMLVRAQAANYAGQSGWPKSYIWEQIWNDGSQHEAEELAKRLDFDPYTEEEPEPPPTQIIMAPNAAIDPKTNKPIAPNTKEKPVGKDKAVEQFVAGLSLIRAANKASKGVRLPITPVTP